jgi:hypothetical protein
MTRGGVLRWQAAPGGKRGEERERVSTEELGHWRRGWGVAALTCSSKDASSLCAVYAVEVCAGLVQPEQRHQQLLEDCSLCEDGEGLLEVHGCSIN